MNNEVTEHVVGGVFQLGVFLVAPMACWAGLGGVARPLGLCRGRPQAVVPTVQLSGGHIAISGEGPAAEGWLAAGTLGLLDLCGHSQPSGSEREEARMEPQCPGWFGHGEGGVLAGGPVLAPICQGSWTGGFMPRTDPVSSNPAVPATLRAPPRSDGRALHRPAGWYSTSDVGDSGPLGVCV